MLWYCNPCFVCNSLSISARGLVGSLTAVVHRAPGDFKPLKRVEKRDQSSNGLLTLEEDTINGIVRGAGEKQTVDHC